MKIYKNICFICFALIFLALSSSGAAQSFSDTIRAYLQLCLETEKINAGIVVGIVDEHGRRIISYGKLDNGTDKDVDGDTVFEIGSDTKTFTALLLQGMIQRAEMKLNDPLEKYLPSSVKVPMRNGKKITLRHLATHTSGLPIIPDNLDPKRADNPYADYSVGKLYAFLSSYQLTGEPGGQSEYSNLGMGLLGHVMALKAGTNYEALVVDRICRPLKMDSTRITLTPELKARFAVGHDLFGEKVQSWNVPVLAGAGALRSTVNDLLKYVSAYLGLTPSSLTPLMKRTCENGLAWFTHSPEPGTKIVSHGGGTGGQQSFVGFDPVRRRGAVVLFNGRRVVDIEGFGKFLLTSDWRSKGPMEIKFTNNVPKLIKLPAAIQLDAERLDAIVGRYEFAPSADKALFAGMQLTIRRNGDQLAGRVYGANTLEGMFDIHAESETNFIIKINGTRLTFMKNARGEVTTVVHHETGIPDIYGRKVSPSAE